MTLITVERIKAYGEYLGFYEELGYLYQIENTLYTYNKDGIKKL